MHTTSITLLNRVRLQSDEAAWNQFVKLYTPLLFFWSRRVGLGPDDAEDFVQELLLLLLQKLPAFEHRGAGSFRGWLRTVALNKFRERLRRRPLDSVGGDGKSVELLEVRAESDAFWEAEYRQQLVARALQIMQVEFEPKTWQACWQRIVENRAATEIARDLDMTVGSVYVYTGRVLQRLRDELADLLD